MRTRLLTAVLLFCLAAPARADEPFRYAEATHGKGELRYVNGVPVLFVRGTPEEIGEQVGVLGRQPVPQLVRVAHDFLKVRGLAPVLPLLTRMGEGLLRNAPADHRRELEAAARALGADRELPVLANTIYDIAKISGCSTLLVEPGRSATGGPLFGRNLDFFPVANAYQYSLVIVYRPNDKHAFASVAFPGLFGCMSGMNDAGLALAANEVTSTADGSPRIEPAGVPLVFTFRRILEECTTVEEAERLLRGAKRTTTIALTVCDRHHGVVFEITPRNVVVRRPVDDLCACTNHFRTSGLATSLECRRFDELEKGRQVARFDVPAVGRYLHKATGGDWTLQTMVFEPRDGKLHLALGKPPTSALPLRKLDLHVLFGHGN